MTDDAAGPVLLALETSTDTGSVAVGGASPLAELVLGVRARHGSSLLPAVDTVLDAAELGRGDLGGVVVGGGPGSFTGLRVAAATAKGLVRALGVPLYAYSGLLALAAGLGRDGPVCALLDARRREVYAAIYRIGEAVETIEPPTVGPLDAVLEAALGHGAAFAGGGALRYRAAIEERGGRVLPAHLAVPRASSLLWLAARWPERGLVASPGSWEPAYLRDAGAKRGVHG